MLSVIMPKHFSAPSLIAARPRESLTDTAGVGSGEDMAPPLADYLGIKHRFIDGTMTGESSFEFHVQHAAAAIREG